MHLKQLQEACFWMDDFWDPNQNPDVDELRSTWLGPQQNTPLYDAFLEYENMMGDDLLDDSVENKDHGRNSDGNLVYYGGKATHRIEVTHPKNEDQRI